MKRVSYAACLKTLANDLRMRIIIELEKNPCSVQALCKVLREEQSKVSHALQRLLTCHFLVVQSSGKQRIYSLNPKVKKGIPVSKQSANIFQFLEHHKAVCCDNKCKKCN